MFKSKYLPERKIKTKEDFQAYMDKVKASDYILVQSFENDKIITRTYNRKTNEYTDEVLEEKNVKTKTQKITLENSDEFEKLKAKFEELKALLEETQKQSNEAPKESDTQKSNSKLFTRNKNKGGK